MYRTGNKLGTTIYHDSQELPVAMVFNLPAGDARQLAGSIAALLNSAERQIQSAYYPFTNGEDEEKTQ